MLKLGARLGWVVNATPRPLEPSGKSPGTNCTGGWEGQGPVLTDVDKRKSLMSVEARPLRN
jgi:hypothetical protein